MICDVDIAVLNSAQPEKRPGSGVNMELLSIVSDAEEMAVLVSSSSLLWMYLEI